MDQNSVGTYRAATGKEYRFQMGDCDRDLDHMDSCVFTFQVEGPTRSFEKVIAIGPHEVPPGDAPVRLSIARELARAKLCRKLDDDNEADEPTPLA